MAHTCPACGKYCTCSGDWDDINFGEWSKCRCPCEDEENDDDEDDWHEWDEKRSVKENLKDSKL